MSPEDRKNLAALVGKTLTFYGRPVNDFAIGVWTAACVPFTYGEVAGALTKHAIDPERGGCCPMPADVIRQLAGTRADRSLLAWNQALEAVRAVGSWGSVVFSDKLIHAVIADMGGWLAFCALPTDQMSFNQHRFSELYRAYAVAPELVSAPPQLTGQHDANNARFGISSLPTLIGNDENKPRRLN